MRRALFTFFYALSLLSSLAILALWVYGVWGCAKISVTHDGPLAGDTRVQTLDVTSWPGWVEWTVVYSYESPTSGLNYHYPGYRWWAAWFGRPPVPESRAWMHWGFGWRREDKTPSSNYYRRAATPHWLLALVTGVMPIRTALLRVRAARRRRRGVCVRCAYDLRGNVDSARCPECGTAVAGASGPSTTPPATR